MAAVTVGSCCSCSAASTSGTLEVDHAGPDVHVPKATTGPCAPTGLNAIPTTADTDCANSANDDASSPAAVAETSGAGTGGLVGVLESAAEVCIVPGDGPGSALRWAAR